MFLCLLRRECYEENYLSFTCLNNFANDSKKKKTQKLTRFLSGCLFVYTFCQFLQVDSYFRTKNFTITCQKRLVLHFVNIVTITELILLAWQPGLLKVDQEMGTKELSSHCIFCELQNILCYRSQIVRHDSWEDHFYCGKISCINKVDKL